METSLPPCSYDHERPTVARGLALYDSAETVDGPAAARYRERAVGLHLAIRN